MAIWIIVALLAYIAWKLRYVAGLVVGVRHDLRQLLLTDEFYEHISQNGERTNRLHVAVSLLERISETTRSIYKQQRREERGE